MPRKNNTSQRRKQLLPILAETFAELGYRRTTTAELARRCEVQENILYRLWSDKREMFLAAINHVFENSMEVWENLLTQRSSDATAAERILEYEARHHGEFGLYRIVFAGLSETDDPGIRAKLNEMYTRFHRFIRKHIAAHQEDDGEGPFPIADLAAWALVGLGTMSNISRELGLLSERRRIKLVNEIGWLLINGKID